MDCSTVMPWCIASLFGGQVRKWTFNPSKPPNFLIQSFLSKSQINLLVNKGKIIKKHQTQLKNMVKWKIGPYGFFNDLPTSCPDTKSVVQYICSSKLVKQKQNIFLWIWCLNWCIHSQKVLGKTSGNGIFH